jgi:hypothetical protein
MKRALFIVAVFWPLMTGVLVGMFLPFFMGEEDGTTVGVILILLCMYLNHRWVKYYDSRHNP